MGPDFLAMLEVLVQQQVDFVIAGALSALLQGAPVMTFDLDIIHGRDEENLNHLTFNRPMSLYPCPTSGGR